MDKEQERAISGFLDADPPRNLPSSAPPRPRKYPGLAGSIAAAVAYGLAPGLLSIERTGMTDETVAASIGLAIGFVDSIDVLSLCAGDKERKRVERATVAKGGATGAAAGVGTFAALAQAGLVAADLATGGAITIGTLVVGAGTALWISRATRTKNCERCKEVRPCTEIACGKCFWIFFPHDWPLDCNKQRTLSWGEIASYLQREGLNYAESIALVNDHFSEWDNYKNKHGKPVSIKCQSFFVWVDENIEAIVAYKGTYNKGDPMPELTEKHLARVAKNAVS